MSTWLKAWRNQESANGNQSIMELVVVEGLDAGSQFTLEGEEVLIGRSRPDKGPVNFIQLDDPSVSRNQALIRCSSSGVSIEHIKAASNATRVNGREVDRSNLSAGDRIEIGRVAIDVRMRDGINLQGDKIWIEDREIIINENQTMASPRVGVEFAEEAGKWPWRFRIKDNGWTSPAK